VRGGVLDVALQQARRGGQQECHHRAVRLGAIQRALKGAFTCGRIPERVQSGRLLYVRHSQPDSPHKSGAVQDRAERGERGVRVMSAEAQPCGGHADLRMFAVLLAEPG